MVTAARPDEDSCGSATAPGAIRASRVPRIHTRTSPGSNEDPWPLVDCGPHLHAGGVPLNPEGG